MKNKGFTLVEMLAVISILAFLALVITPIVVDVRKRSKEKTYVNQTKTLEETAERWSVKNVGLLSETEKYYLNIDTLVNEKYLTSNEVYDPRDNTKMNGCIIISYDSGNMQYEFNYTERTCTELRG